MSKVSNAVGAVVAQTGIPVSYIGKPGSGKTSWGLAVARVLGRMGLPVVLTQRDPLDLHGAPSVGEIPPWIWYGKQQVPTGASAGSPGLIWRHPDLAVVLKEHPCLLILDDAPSATSQTQVTLFEMCAERSIAGMPFHDKTMIFLFGNDAASGSNVTDYSPPLANRICNLEWLVDEDEFQAALIAGAYPPPTVPALPDNWTDWVPEVGAQFSVALKHVPNLMPIHEFKPGRKAAASDRNFSRGWESHRSWMNAVKAIAAVRACQMSRDEERRALTGMVGPTSALAFYSWLENQDLPDPEEVLGWAIKDYVGKATKYPVSPNKYANEFTYPNRDDKAYLILLNTMATVHREPTVDRINGLMHLLTCFARKRKDIVHFAMTPVVKTLYQPHVLSKQAGSLSKDHPELSTLIKSLV
jgi:hypothetical protein